LPSWPKTGFGKEPESRFTTVTEKNKMNKINRRNYLDVQIVGSKNELEQSSLIHLKNSRTFALM
jgi:hypothetical protein